MSQKCGWNIPIRPELRENYYYKKGAIITINAMVKRGETRGKKMHLNAVSTVQ